MITTDAPGWLRRSDQAALRRTYLGPLASRRAVHIRRRIPKPLSRQG